MKKTDEGWMADSKVNTDEIKVELWEADPICNHECVPLGWNGIRCVKCGGWYKHK